MNKLNNITSIFVVLPSFSAGVTTTYYYDGTTLIAEETSGAITVYLYDSTGSPVGMKYRTSSYAYNTWDTYWFEKNLQGDIIGVYSNTGTKLITYNYDPWGEFNTTYYNGGANTTAVNNNLRYRGYYYDSDLQLYYLISRYYDSNTGRFINADSALYHRMLGYNMYVYCNNNPINYFDPTGEDAVTALNWWTGICGSIAVAEPTAIGEAILVAGLIVIGAVVVVESAAEGIQDLIDSIPDEKEQPDDPPQSIGDAVNDGETDQIDDIKVKPSSPGKMQREVIKGRAPKEVKRVDNPKNGKPHIHFKDGTSLNYDGTIHDTSHGVPNITKKIGNWLVKHNWSSEIKLFH